MAKKHLPNNVAAMVAAAEGKLDLANARLSPPYYYNSLPFAVVDAVFSIGVRYEQVRHAVHFFAQGQTWQPIYRQLGTDFPAEAGQKTINDLIAAFEGKKDPAAALFANRGFANPAARKPVRKAEVVLAVAKVLAAHGVQTFQGLARHAHPETLDRALREEPPAMSSGIIVHYLRMLAGDDNEVKVDRMIQRFIESAGVSRSNQLEEAIKLVRETAHALRQRGFPNMTPRLLDHLIWSFQRQQDRPKPSGKARRRRSGMPVGRAGATATVAAPNLRDRVEFDEFWTVCRLGGVTPEGLAYDIDDDERLRIISPRAKSQKYRILKSTVRGYLPRVHEGHFRRSHGWFCRVHEHILRRA